MRLFGSSGIRGLVNREIDCELALKVGLAVATLGPGGVVCTGRDTRKSSDMIASAAISGLLAGGCDVLDLGVLPTPALAYLTKASAASCGLMVTASHNPPEYNGIKLFGPDSSAFEESPQNKIERIIHEDAFHREEWANLHKSTTIDKSHEYTGMVIENITLRRRWRVALDACNGAASVLAPDVMRELECNVISLNAQPDELFLGRDPEPSQSSLRFLAAAVQAHQCDIGIAYDGDGDRVSVTDENGRYVSPDLALAAFAAHAASRSRGGAFAFPVDASLVVKESVEQAGGRVFWTPVGDMHVAKAIKEHGAIFGGEPSGAWIHPSFHFCPDGILSGALLLQAIEESGQTASAFFHESNQYAIRRWKINCPNDIKHKAVELWASKFMNSVDKMLDVTDIDGYRVSFSDAWVLTRASGTEPTIRVTAEARTEHRLTSLFEIAVRLCTEAVEGVSA